MLKRYKTSEKVSDYRKRLKRLGFHLLGSGVYASVFHHKKSDPDWVFKVGTIHTTPENDGWLQYALKVSKSPRNPWLPRVGEIHICEYSSRMKETRGEWGYYVAKVEKLTHVSDEEGGCIADDIDMVISALNEVGIEEQYQSIPIATKLQLIGDKNLISAIRLIAELVVSDSAFETDLHYENIMKRDNGHIVISDPIQ